MLIDKSFGFLDHNYFTSGNAIGASALHILLFPKVSTLLQFSNKELIGVFCISSAFYTAMTSTLFVGTDYHPSPTMLHIILFEHCTLLHLVALVQFSCPGVRAR
jgi:hypothetical protein